MQKYSVNQYPIENILLWVSAWKKSNALGNGSIDQKGFENLSGLHVE